MIVFLEIIIKDILLEQAYNSYHLHTKVYPTLFSQGSLSTQLFIWKRKRPRFPFAVHGGSKFPFRC